MQRPAHGFTLLELLVAIAIFAVLAALAYGGLRSVIDARTQTREVSARLAALQETFLMLGQDLSQAVPRPVRDGFGDARPALAGMGPATPADAGPYSLSLVLTRAGVMRPVGLHADQLATPAAAVDQSVAADGTTAVVPAPWQGGFDLARVGYGLQDGRLYRYVWPVLDRAQDSQPERLALLDHVANLQLRFLDAQGQWQTQWPASGTSVGATGDDTTSLPRAISVSLELTDWGRIERVFLLPGGAA